MAIYPCDYCRKRYRAAQQSVYWTEFGAHVVTPRAVRLCPEHFDLVADAIENTMTHIDDAGEVSGCCDGCSEPRSFGVSARVYREHAREAHFVGDYCAPCLSRLGNELRIYNGRVLERLSDALR